MGKIVELKPQENPGGWGGSDVFGSSLFLCLISFLIKAWGFMSYPLIPPYLHAYQPVSIYGNRGTVKYNRITGKA